MYFEIGRIVNTQGIKGEMRVVPTTDDISRFSLLSHVFVFDGNYVEYKIESVRYHKNFVVMKLEGINSINEANTLRNKTIKILRENALPLEENEYYIYDLYDMKVIDENGEELGFVSDILFTGANDVYVVKGSTKKDLLIPAIKDCILDIDIINKVMTVKLLEGLREI